MEREIVIFYSMVTYIWEKLELYSLSLNVSSKYTSSERSKEAHVHIGGEDNENILSYINNKTCWCLNLQDLSVALNQGTIEEVQLLVYPHTLRLTMMLLKNVMYIFVHLGFYWIISYYVSPRHAHIFFLFWNKLNPIARKNQVQLPWGKPKTKGHRVHSFISMFL